MHIFIYDKTFEGLLTLIFEAYELKYFPVKIVSYTQATQYILVEKHEVVTQPQKAERVWKGLQQRISNASCQMLHHTFLSELPDAEMYILKYAKKVFDSKTNIETNFSDTDVLTVFNISKKVMREAHRIPMFVRFQKTTDNIYYASIDPMYNVLPLAINHFEDRFANQQWIIYDTRRKFGYFYNLTETVEVRFSNSNIHPTTGILNTNLYAPNESDYQDLWKSYFNALCIKERINPKLHKQLLPKRFWKYLPEKN